jgi:urease accessory protein
LASYFHGFAANLVSAGVRLIPLGQSDGQSAVAALEPAVAKAGAQAATIMQEDLGTAAPLLDLCSMQHETQYSRLFRS